ncbi:LysR family transcriptional regulator [Noviherbaspirillum denitrificans]|uniref:LysR family transcriptional regulator n=1 Tax=Noviherbaspirillum denitrificans TaxID=1968433 RepID=A0A254TRZ6_9BURK|nr:LysR family transcriptional regulator [Noviherbaspirillum denitrificans]OWW22498.1 LysR family transcriptional regulator [Noviherbaspirillum denitrificans]
MDKFQEMQAFVAVVDNGSFVRAADALNTSKAAISRQVADLEQRLGIRLLHRTTRKLSMTDEGQLFYTRCSELLNGLQEAEAELNLRSGEPSGHLRISAPVTFGVAHLAPLWGRFLHLHPKISMEVSLSDRTVDLVEDGFDLAVRIARAPHPSFIARRLASTSMVLCASPGYLKRHGAPAQPQDIASHNVISYSYWSSKDEWEFIRPGGKTEVVRTKPRLHANSGDTCVAAALQDQGIVLQPDFLVYEALRDGRLKRLLADYQTVELGIYAIYASRRQLPLKLRYLIDFLVTSFEKPAWGAGGDGSAVIQSPASQ